jgi:hydroxymethylglutaryl-CoA lyase
MTNRAMTNQVQIVECPRDAWQALPAVIPAETKAAYLHALIEAGCTHIDAVSFVSPRAVPQMADSEQVLALLKPPSSVEIIGIIVNNQGAQRAIQSGAVTTLGFPYSISPAFLRRNQNQTPAESLAALESVVEDARHAGLRVVAYLSMAFGNPYGDPWSIEQVIASCLLLIRSGAQQLSLADTVGLAAPELVAEVFSAVYASVGADAALGLHLHARPDNAAAKIRAAYLAGCRRFDTAFGGFGGCPFAQDALVGNIATETAIAELTQSGATLPRITALEALTARAQALNTNYSMTKTHSPLKEL